MGVLFPNWDTVKLESRWRSWIAVFFRVRRLGRWKGRQIDWRRLTEAAMSPGAEEMRVQAHGLCRDYLHGAWQLVSADDMVIKPIR